AELVLAGEGESDRPYAEGLRQYVRERGLEGRVRFIGAQTVPNMAAEYARCAFVVLPSRQETASVVIQEAMAVGRPVVATRVGGAPYTIEDGRTGLLVDYGDERGLAEQMRRLLDDEAICRQMGAAARAVALRRFQADVVAQETVHVYRALASAASGWR
ncbi:MAG: glycosyltransferase, partial [Chloroflexi bacterium]|nr:glycosyltransferase [Chloroflexota bacterium]